MEDYHDRTDLTLQWAAWGKEWWPCVRAKPLQNEILAPAERRLRGGRGLVYIRYLSSAAYRTGWKLKSELKPWGAISVRRRFYNLLMPPIVVDRAVTYKACLRGEKYAPRYKAESTSRQLSTAPYAPRASIDTRTTVDGVGRGGGVHTMHLATWRLAGHC